ncbi:MAG: AEC family transporter, partial [Anaerolineales bacterium]|nr:AEC family transporter [Anaerolineales bacterium]
MLQTIAPIFLIVGAAMLVGRFKPLDVQTLSRVSIYLFSPALVLGNVLDSSLSTGEMGRIILAAMLSCALMAAAGTALARALRYDRRLASAFALTAFVMNTVNFGFPFIEFAYGPAGLAPAVVFAVGQSLMAYLLGAFVASRGQSSVKTAVRNALTIPTPYAFL